MDLTNAMVLYAFRYCLGRASAAPSDCVAYLINHWNEFDPLLQQRIVEEIQQALDANQAGMACDRASWQQVLDHASEVA